MVLLHGIPYDHFSGWIYQIAHFSQLFKIISLDFPGFGRSPPPKTSCGIGDLVKDVVHVLDRLAVKSCFLVGSSLGGIVATQLAISYPRRVRAAILCGTPSSGVGKGISAKFLMRIEKYDKLSVQGHLREHIESHFTEEFVRSTLGAYIINLVYERSSKISKSTLITMFKAMRDWDPRPDLARIKCPVLAIVAEHDEPVEEYIELPDSIPGSKLVLVKKARHASPIAEKPWEFDKAVIDFLRRQGYVH